MCLYECVCKNQISGDTSDECVCMNVFVRIRCLVTHLMNVSPDVMICNTTKSIVTYDYAFPTLVLLLLLKKIGNARPGEGDCHPMSPKTPATHYQPIEEKKRKGKSFKTKK